MLCGLEEAEALRPCKVQSPCDECDEDEDEYTEHPQPPQTGRDLFSADANAGSSAANRFRIVFKKASQSTDEVKPRFVIAPNPVESGSMHLQFKNQPAGTYYVRLINTAGQIVFAGAITHTGGSVTHKVVVPEAITNGHYKAAIHQPGKATETLQVLLNRK